MAQERLHPRFAEPRLRQALADTPVVLIHGPRQCGKTTLVQQVGTRAGYAYRSFDDKDTLAAAKTDGTGFVHDLPEKVILDEVQRVPELFSTIKLVVDRNRVPGRFLMTGSANVLLAPKLSDSLAGRIEIQRLHPLAQSEIAGRPPKFLKTLFDGRFEMKPRPRLGRELASRIAHGGYPAALAREPGRRAAWYRSYVETMVQRDVRDLARIASLDVLPRLLKLTAAQSARLVNISELGGPLELSRPTIRDYVTLLKGVFLLDELPPWHSNRLSRLVKTPKLHLGDTGVACALLDRDATSLWEDRALLGQMLETFVYQELRRQASWRDDEIRFHHFRDRDNFEVDLVLERESGNLAGVEVKAAASVVAADFRGLRKLKEAVGKRFRAGIVLYDGEAALPFGEGFQAVPLSELWAA
ncbi:MAG: ATP-binding protein [Betaproteobacteria bacterium]|nr:ATP-binding protein [Betaproteobacteria bacterium]